MPTPLIGITIHPKTAPDRAELDLLVEAIVQRVERANGLPVLIPLGLNDDTLRQLYIRLDGVLLSGGGDIDPVRYGGQLHVNMGGMDGERDRTEFTLASWSAEGDKPLFGICRGAQVLNVALGGSLYSDVSEHTGALRHDYYPGLPFDLRPHEIRIEEESTLAKVIGQPIVTVNSLHHQAVKDLAPGLRATAHAPDGLVEAIEIPGRAFALAVQWHPECLPEAPEMRRLFETFVEAARVVK